jgi:hypothetical protein
LLSEGICEFHVMFHAWVNSPLHSRIIGEICVNHLFGTLSDFTLYRSPAAIKYLSWNFTTFMVKKKAQQGVTEQRPMNQFAWIGIHPAAPCLCKCFGFPDVKWQY